MDSRYIDAVECQGLKGSMITTQHVPTIFPRLMHRDATVLLTLLELMSHSVSVLALQECSRDFLAILKTKMLGGHYRAVPGSGGDAVLLYHTELLQLTNHTLHAGSTSAFSGKRGVGKGKPILEAIFTTETGSTLRVVGGKIAGDPTGPHLGEYARFVARLRKRKGLTILLGDFNFLENEVMTEMQRAGAQAVPAASAVPGARYPTNVQPITDVPDGFGGGPLAPKRIDHILVLGRADACRLLEPDSLLPGLQRVVDVLKTGGACVEEESSVKEEGAVRVEDRVQPVWERCCTVDDAEAFLNTTDEDSESDSDGIVFEEEDNDTLRLGRTISETVADESNVTRAHAREVLDMAAIATANNPEREAIKWIEKDLARVAKLL